MGVRRVAAGIIGSGVKMREIKFRQPIYDNEGNFNRWHYWGFIDGGFKGIIPPIHSAERLSQQYTGLHDKKDKEIYEGDYARFPNTEYRKRKPSDKVGEVVFSNGVFKLSPTSSRWNDLYLSILSTQVEVIGNIYENPDLLEPVKESKPLRLSEPGGIGFE